MQNRNRKNTAICDGLPDSNQSARSSLKENIKLKHKGTLLIGSADCPDNLCGVWHFSTYTVVSFPSSQVIMQDEVASPGRNDHLVPCFMAWNMERLACCYNVCKSSSNSCLFHKEHFHNKSSNPKHIPTGCHPFHCHLSMR